MMRGPHETLLIGCLRSVQPSSTVRGEEAVPHPDRKVNSRCAWVMCTGGKLRIWSRLGREALMELLNAVCHGSWEEIFADLRAPLGGSKLYHL